jgi:hypothetical protein
MVSIKFKTFGATSAGGSFGPGDIMRCDEKLAKHLVDEAQCAVYLQAPQPVQAPSVEIDADQPQVRRARRASKE